METIKYYAADSSMGDTTAENCELFRNWAKSELESEYPEYDIVVADEQSMITATTTDHKNEDAIIEFCS